MNPWITLAATVLGAAIAASVALLLDRRRHEREREARKEAQERDDRLRSEQLKREDEIRVHQTSIEAKRQWAKELRELASQAILDCKRWSNFKYEVVDTGDDRFITMSSGSDDHLFIRTSLDALLDQLSLLASPATVKQFELMREASSELSMINVRRDGLSDDEARARAFTYSAMSEHFAATREAFLASIRKDIQLD